MNFHKGMNLIDSHQQKKNKINTPITIQDWFNQVRQERPGHSRDFNNSIRVLLCHILNKNKSWLAANTDHLLGTDQLSTLDSLLVQLKDGVPLAYLIGHCLFLGSTFTLIDRCSSPGLKQNYWLKKQSLG
jgi:methylase of polypeptide subunit release factors